MPDPEPEARDHDAGVEYVGFWERLAAVAFDETLLAILTWPPLAAIYGRDYFLSDAIIYGAWDVVLAWVLPPIVTVLFWNAYAATPGKMLIGARIVDAYTFEKPSLWRYALRYAGYVASALPFLLGYVGIAFTKRKQGLHDAIARTVVIRARPRLVPIAVVACLDALAFGAAIALVVWASLSPEDRAALLPW
ncbi:RDD family protein [bacterium]|nr:RDD family protein [bacterium]